MYKIKIFLLYNNILSKMNKSKKKNIAKKKSSFERRVRI